MSEIMYFVISRSKMFCGIKKVFRNCCVKTKNFSDLFGLIKEHGPVIILNLNSKSGNDNLDYVRKILSVVL